MADKEASTVRAEIHHVTAPKDPRLGFAPSSCCQINFAETGSVSGLAKNTTATLIPCLRYRDAPAAIAWLCGVFGFEQHAVYPGEGNTIAHAELSYGHGMIMLGSMHENEYGKLMKQPDEIGGHQTQTIYAIVGDADAVYRRAKAAGAKIELDIKDEDYGGRGFTCRDLEGHVWTFGTYDPWG